MTNDEKWDAYFYPNSDVLINKLGITDKEELKAKEAEISFERLVELYDDPIVGSFDSEHWKEIHKYLFGDIYEWAGTYRNVDMRKVSTFTHYEYIDLYLRNELSLMNEEIKNVRDKYRLASFLADYYCHLMSIHPFREGNGRSGREFLREFVKVKTENIDGGPYKINWENFDGKTVEENANTFLVFRGPIEREFLKSLESDKKEERIR